MDAVRVDETVPERPATLFTTFGRMFGSQRMARKARQGQLRVGLDEPTGAYLAGESLGLGYPSQQVECLFGDAFAAVRLARRRQGRGPIADMVQTCPRRRREHRAPTAS